MVDMVVSKSELIDAQKDAQSLDDVVNGTAEVQIQTRLGRYVWTLATLEQRSLLKISQWQDAISLITATDGIPALAVSDASGKNQQQINDELRYDSGIYTWSGLTQEEKNKERISAQDFKAKGDGVTNDTAAFIDLEAMYQGQIIDLLGKTYLVDALPSESNTYINGFFKVGDSVITAKGNFKKFSDTTATSFSLDIAGELWSTRAQMVRYTAGASSVVQSIAVDEVNRYFYSLTASTPKLICRYDYDNKLYNQSIDQNNDTNNVLGHQGLSVEHLGGGDTLLWTSSDTSPNTGSSAHTFKYKPLADGAITLEEDWTLFPIDGTSQSITPNISIDQRYLIVMRQFNESDGSGVLVRVFDMQTIKKARSEGRYNISNEFVSEFRYKDVGSPPEVSRQDVACDGHYIYILWGTWSIDTDDFILKFDMRGNLVQKYNSHNIGLQNSIDGGTEGQHEPEGLCFVSSPKGGYTLLYQVAFGDTGGRKCWVYELGGEQPIQSYTDKVPSLLLSSNEGLEICAPTDEGIGFGTYSTSAGYRKHLEFDRFGRVLKGLDSSLPIDGTTNGFQWHSVDTQANAIFGRWAAGTSQYAQVALFKSTGTTIGESVANPSGATLGALSFYTDIGTGTSANIGKLCAGITASTTAEVVGGNSPSRLNFFTTSDSGSYASRWAIDSNGDLFPNLSNNYSIGSASNLVKTIYAGTGTINTSDERLKQQFRSQSEAERDAALEIKNSIYLFKFNDAVDLKGDGARWHVGVKAQQVVSILESYNLNPFDYAFVCFDEWEAQDEIIESWDDEHGEEGDIIRKAGSQVVQEYREAGSRYAIRYEELTMFILSAI